LRVSGVGRDGRLIRVAGTLLHPGERERLIEVWNTPVDVEPTDQMAFFRYDDRPGVIGTIGTGSAKPVSTSPRRRSADPAAATKRSWRCPSTRSSAVTSSRTSSSGSVRPRAAGVSLT
jgi:hypothetical protein